MSSNELLSFISTEKSPITLNLCATIDYDGEKGVVLNFINESDTRLISMCFKIKFFNSNNEIIEENEYIFHDAYVKAGKGFTPKRFISLPNDCVMIEYKLLKAVFNNCVWEDGIYRKLENPEQMLKESDSLKVSNIEEKVSLLYLFIPLFLIVVFMIYYFYTFPSTF